MNFPVPPVEPIYKRTSHAFHLILTVITFGMWALLVWWWWAPMQNASNNKKRRAYQREMEKYQRDKWAWDQAHMQPPPGQYPHYGQA